MLKTIPRALEDLSALVAFVELRWPQPASCARYLTDKQEVYRTLLLTSASKDDFNKTPELQVCIAEALYDIESILSDPDVLPKEEIRTLRDQIASNLERAWELTGGSEDQLTGTMLQISQVVS